jgi:hypothetical protein
MSKKKKLIIAFGGRKHSGKSLAAELTANIADNFGLDWEVISFADKLKEVAASIFPIDRNKENDAAYKEALLPEPCSHLTPRHIYQTLGTDIARKLWADVWVYHTDLKIVSSTADVILIPDLRFDNEMDYLLRLQEQDNLYVVLVNIVRYTDEKDNHDSERGLSPQSVFKYDLTIFNDASLTEYVSKVRAYLGGVVKTFIRQCNDGKLTA